MNGTLFDSLVPDGLEFDPLTDPARGRHLVLALPWGAQVDPQHEDSGGHVLQRGDVLVDRDLVRQGFVNVNHRPGTVGGIVDAVENQHGIWAVVDLTDEGERVLAEGNGDVSAEIIMPGLRWYFTGLALVSKDETPAIPGSRVVFSNKRYRTFAVVARQPNTEESEPMTEAATKAKPTPAAEAAQAFDFEGYLTTAVDRMAESHEQLTKSLAESLGESFSAAMRTALEDLPNPQAAAGPQPVRAARYTITREEPVYALNGRGNSLVRDAWYSRMEHDSEASERLRRFRLQTEELAKYSHSVMAFAGGRNMNFTAVSTANAGQLVPPGYRPDLFIPMLNQQRPLANACSQGMIDNATPFVVPVFGSFSGATADNVEGSNPTDGTLSFTTKTVTPGAISGILNLNREIVDSSNPAIDQIALQAMRESYSRQTEGKVYTELNGPNGLGGTLTPGTAEALSTNPNGAYCIQTADGTALKLPVAIRRLLANYPFKRFAAPNSANIGQVPTSALATAVGTDNRPLFPSIGAMNDAGIGNAVQQGWYVDGMPFVPAWSVTGVVGSNDTHVIVMNSIDAWIWESPTLVFRFEEKLGPAQIQLALFGYFGVHVLRPIGLAGIRMTAP